MMLLFFVLSFLLSSRPQSHASVTDFCVADLNGPNTPAGYPCKDTANATADDFVFSGFREAGYTIDLLKAGVSTAFVTQFPGVNGLGISAARLDLAPGGVIPIHSHPRASELLFVVSGRTHGGFIDSHNTVYSKTLYKGDMMVIPQGLLHYQINDGDETATLVVSFTSASPGTQITDFALFASDLPSAVIEKAAFLDDSQVRKLKALMGGTN